MARNLGSLAGTFALWCTTLCVGQTTGISGTALVQTRLIETATSIGTAFTIEVDKREYWITAKHIITGIEAGPPGLVNTKTVVANLLLPYSRRDEAQEKRWQTVRFTVIDPGKDIDILVLAPERPVATLLPPDSMKAASDTNPNDVNALVPIGGDCEFLGYPYGGSWKASTPGSRNKSPSPTDGWFWSPFAKRCMLSGTMVKNGVTIFVLDGINNLGFSGGPVIIGRGASTQVFAVVSGFHPEPLEVLSAPDPAQPYVSPLPPPPALPGQKATPARKQIVESNSGLILAYDITPAIRAIRAHPIGPSH